MTGMQKVIVQEGTNKLKLLCYRKKQAFPLVVTAIFTQTHYNQIFRRIYINILAKYSFCHKITIRSWQPPLVFIIVYIIRAFISYRRFLYPFFRYYLLTVPIAFIEINPSYFCKIPCPCIKAAIGLFQAIFLSVETPGSVVFHS